MTLADDRNLVEAFVAGASRVPPSGPPLSSPQNPSPCASSSSTSASSTRRSRPTTGSACKVAPGEIHAVLGENGAGKSTLMKIIYGAVRPDEGEIRWNGEPVQIASPAAARALGISMVYQHFSLFDTLTAAENVWLGLDKSLSLAEVTKRIREVAGIYGLEVDPLRPVHTLSVGERQRVEIVRALMTNPKLLILDEPTSVLTPQAVETLFVTLRKLAAEGCSHPLHQPQARRDPRALPPLHGAARRQGHRRGRPDPGDQRQPVAPDDRRRAAAAAAPRGPRRRGGARGARASRLPRKTRSARPSRTSPSRCAPARSSASPASRATASRS